MAPVVAFLVPLAWALGTFPAAGIVARAHGLDVTSAGSGNPGASNIARLLGWRWGAVVLLGDFAKGAIASGAGLWVGGRSAAFVLGAAAVLGHTLPLYRKGGKGVATAGGALTVLYPWLAVGTAIVWLVVARLLHKASVASLVIVVGFPVAVIVTGHDLWEDLVVTALAVLIVGRHLPNIRRLLRHEELDLGRPQD